MNTVGQEGSAPKRRHRLLRHVAAIALSAGLLAAFAADAQSVGTLKPELAAKVRSAVAEVIARTHVPGMQVGIVQDGKIAYVEAFGYARLSPPQPVSVAMHFAVGSISKQFTVAAVMLLQQQGKLSIDDPVSKWFPELTRSREVTLRNLMSHTSGYEDYAPQDYTIPKWTQPSAADAIVHEWATKPLDFDPGTEYQYSNTNFNIVGLIVQKVTGQPFWAFLKAHVLDPVGLANVIDLDSQHDRLEPTGYFQHALGPLRPALMEAPGWYFADGEMAMPVSDLLKWDISVINRTLLSAASYAQMEAPTRFRNGVYGTYGLGLSTGATNGHRRISHGGEVGGFVALNVVFPDDRVAVAVLTNQEASAAAKLVGVAITDLLLPPAVGTSAAMSPKDTEKLEAHTREVLSGLQQGHIDRNLFTADANFYFDKTAIEDYASSLGSLGAIHSLHQKSTELRGGMRFSMFTAEFAKGAKVDVSTYWTTEGKIEQFLVGPTS